MKNTTLLGMIALVLVGVGIFFFSAANADSGSTGSVIENTGGAQEITLSMKNFNYDPATIRVKASQPVKLSLDGKVAGCLRSFTIPELGISKYFRTVADVLEFTPTKKGTFAFSCSMGMGSGTLIVE